MSRIKREWLLIVAELLVLIVVVVLGFSKEMIGLGAEKAKTYKKKDADGRQVEDKSKVKRPKDLTGDIFLETEKETIRVVVS